ncbi:MAG: glycoside hydrolase family 36 N-terminal domain-containing protein [Oscillospiraceae bacterium]
MLQRYFGMKLNTGKLIELPTRFACWSPLSKDGVSLDCLAQEYPAYGHSDLRIPAFKIENTDDNHICDLKYLSHKVYDGKLL